LSGPRKIDALVRAIPASDDEIVRHIGRPLNSIPLGSPFGQRYVPPIDDVHPRAGGGPDRYGDPGFVADVLFGQLGIELAILIAANRIIRTDRRHEIAVMRATNQWLAERWLESPGGRYRASIQLAPHNARESVAEIERWASHPGFVQVAVPLQVHAPYGEEEFFPVLEAAAEHGLPVAIHGDGGGGAEFTPTMAGVPTSFVEYHTVYPLGAMVHLVSLISEGVFDRLPKLTVVLTDGCAAVFPPFLWREDAKARALKEEMPWVGRRPTDYLSQVRFIPRRDDFPRDPSQLETMIRLSREGASLLFGSNFPMWDLVDFDSETWPPADAFDAGFVAGNAVATYPKLGVADAARQGG
jgi:predicted TIM-barrel fold metal-dependent hydrolase